MLFLDEVGEMSLPAQAKFLRVLQEREFQRLGGTRVLRTDARIVAATNRDLQKAIANGQFREDLYYRLNVFAIRLPPLRERRDDILPLTQAFLTEFGRGVRATRRRASRATRKQRLLAYHWPGNVRELRNILERAAILCDGGLITDEHLALPLPAGGAHSRPSRWRRRCRRQRRPTAGQRPRRPTLAGRRPAVDGAHDDRAGAAEGALQQVEGGQGARADPPSALHPHAPARPRRLIVVPASVPRKSGAAGGASWPARPSAWAPACRSISW